MSEVRAHDSDLRGFDDWNGGVSRRCQGASEEEKGSEEEDGQVRGDSHVGGVLIPECPMF